MRTIIKNQAGFATLGIVALAVVIIGLVGGAGYLVSKNNTDSKKSAVTQQSNDPAKSIHATKPAFGYATTVTDPDKQKIIALLIPKCGGDAEQTLAAISTDPQKFVIKGYYARVTVQCDGGGFTSYLTKDDAGIWTVLENTQQAPNCKYFDNTPGISADVATTCYDENTLKERTIN